jgi:hypothetical protein
MYGLRMQQLPCAGHGGEWGEEEVPSKEMQAPWITRTGGQMGQRSKLYWEAREVPLVE